VVKTDGLAAGKGVLVATSLDEAIADVRAKLAGESFGEAGRTVVVEEGMTGPELSLLVVCDGTRAVALAPAQDFKRAGDADTGPNTGGMGAYSPVPGVDDALVADVMARFVEPTLAELRRRGIDYRGVLYTGLMLTPEGPKLVEFNVRFGDPEAQVIFPMLDEDLSWLLGAAATGALPSRAARFRPLPHVGIVLAAGGYPDAAESGKAITGIADAARVPGALVFHAGTARRDGQLVTAGGRVLTVVASGDSYRDAIDTAYRAAAHIHFDGMQLRRDIGQKAVL
jgi:phosphoribosylamine--glycine ligase